MKQSLGRLLRSQAGGSARCLRVAGYTSVLRTQRSVPSLCAMAASSTGKAFYATGDKKSASTGRGDEAPSSSRGGESEDPVVRACRWDSAAYVERLGFAIGQSFTEDELRAHFQILAKHFHPDSAAQSTVDTTTAFQNIKEAYDALLSDVRSNGGRYRGGTHGAGFHYSDEERRRSQMKALGEGVLLFMLMTLVLIVVIARYSKERLNSRYLSSLLAIFLIIQMFPRLLAAAILYACHVSYVIQNSELRSQAAVSLLVSQQQAQSLSLAVQGVDPQRAQHVVVQAEVSVNGETNASAVSSTTVTFDKGELRVVVPVPSGQSWHVHVRAHDEHSRQTLVDKVFSRADVDALTNVGGH